MRALVRASAAASLERFLTGKHVIDDFSEGLHQLIPLLLEQVSPALGKFQLGPSFQEGRPGCGDSFHPAP